MADFHLHVGIALDSLKRAHPVIQGNIMQRHGAYVSMLTPLGKTGGKEDMHGLDVFLINAMEAYIERASEHDVLVLISGVMSEGSSRVDLA